MIVVWRGPWWLVADAVKPRVTRLPARARPRWLRAIPTAAVIPAHAGIHPGCPLSRAWRPLVLSPPRSPSSGCPLLAIARTSFAGMTAPQGQRICSARSMLVHLQRPQVSLAVLAQREFTFRLIAW